MVDPRQRELAETVFERNQRREKEINNALKQEYARREAVVKNMYCLRALRLARDARPIGDKIARAFGLKKYRIDKRNPCANSFRNSERTA